MAKYEKQVHGDFDFSRQSSVLLTHFSHKLRQQSEDKTAYPGCFWHSRHAVFPFRLLLQILLLFNSRSLLFTSRLLPCLLLPSASPALPHRLHSVPLHPLLSPAQPACTLRLPSRIFPFQKSPSRPFPLIRISQ